METDARNGVENEPNERHGLERQHLAGPTGNGQTLATIREHAQWLSGSNGIRWSIEKSQLARFIWNAPLSRADRDVVQLRVERLGWRRDARNLRQNPAS